MKTLIFFGSPRPNGHSASILEKLKISLDGEVEVIDCYKTKDIAPCNDCRFCWKKPNCRIKDSMTKIYDSVEKSDNIIIISPLYFHSVTGILKTIIDRFQVYWSASVRKDKPEQITKKGAYFLVGGSPNFENQFLGAELVCNGVLNDLNSKIVGKVEFYNSDHQSITDVPEIMVEINEIIAELNKKI